MSARNGARNMEQIVKTCPVITAFVIVITILISEMALVMADVKWMKKYFLNQVCLPVSR